MNKELFRTFKIRFFLSAALFALFAASFSFMPWAAGKQLEGSQGPLIVLGSVFWLTGLLACLFLHLANKAGNRLDAKASERHKRGCPGLFRFFQNRAATVADCLLILGLLVFFAAGFLQRPNTVLFPAISVLLLLAIVHAFLNGRNFCRLCGGTSAHQDKKEEQKKK